MDNALPHRIKTISQYHQASGLPKPEHRLISIINFDSIPQLAINEPVSFIYDFYSIYLKRISNVKHKYLIIYSNISVLTCHIKLKIKCNKKNSVM